MTSDGFAMAPDGRTRAGSSSPAAGPPGPRARSRVAEAETLNLALAGGHVAANLYQFFVLPLVLMPGSAWWALTLLPLVALNNPLWSLTHETIHGNFHTSRTVKRLAGRVLGVVYGAPWRLVSVGHLLHHRFNRTPLNRLDSFEGGERPGLGARIGYYYKLFIGLYLHQVLSPLAFFLPRRVLAWARTRFLKPGTYSAHAFDALGRDAAIRELRIDGAIIYVLVGLSLAAYGAWWWLVPAILAARGFCISFLDYIYHYETPIDRLEHGYNLTLARPLAAALLNFNLHGVHHRYPALPWNALAEAFARDGGRYDGDYFEAAGNQLRGLVPLRRLEALSAEA